MPRPMRRRAQKFMASLELCAFFHTRSTFRYNENMAAVQLSATLPTLPDGWYVRLTAVDINPTLTKVQVC